MVESMDNLRVLVVEDHSFQLDYVANCLQQIGVKHVHKAQDGHIGLSVLSDLSASKRDVDLVICDLQMPNMDGIEFLRNLAEREFRGAVIILTAMDTTLVASVCKMVSEYKLRFIGALPKPVDTRSLITYVTEACSNDHIDIARPLPSGVDEEDLTKALDSEAIVAHYQPKFDFTSGKLVGVEALARLQLPDGQLIYPDDFIYLYKKLDKTTEFELITYGQAFRLIGSLLKRGIATNLSVNICANMLGDHSFYEAVLQLAKKYSVPHDLITVEVTERSLINNIARSIEFLARLRINGFNLAVDDFGTGYSSIKQLETLPFNEVKIDKSFILGIEKDQQKHAIVQTIVELAARLKLTTVAEGIENQESYDIAKGFGCNVCQGFLTGRPLAEKDIESLIISQQ